MPHLPISSLLEYRQVRQAIKIISPGCLPDCDETGVHMNKQLYSKNFLFLLAGQTLSMFGSRIIRFAISLYLLDATGSAAIYGTVIAISYIPPILFTPFGGILADRGDKKRWMVLLDGTYCTITVIMGIIFQRHGSFLFAAGLMILLTVVASFEGPVSQTCIPLIINRDHLTKGLAVSNQITSLSGLLTPLLSGFLYGIAGKDRLHCLMYFCAALFLFAAGVELLLKIPKQTMEKHNTITETIKCDLKDILRLVFKEKQYIGETMLQNGLLTFLVMPYLSIGMTYLISIKLHLPSIWNGSAQVAAGAATLLGSTVATLISEKFQTKNIYKFLMGMGASFLFLIPALCINMPGKAAFFLVCFTSAAILLLANTAGVFIISGMQKACPQHMLGRLMALFGVCNNLTLPIGIWLHGIIYEKYEDNLSVIFGIIAVLTILISVRGKKVYSLLQNDM